MSRPCLPSEPWLSLCLLCGICSGVISQWRQWLLTLNSQPSTYPTGIMKECVDRSPCCTRAKEVWGLPSQNLPWPAHMMPPFYSVCSSSVLGVVVLQGCFFLECWAGNRANSWRSSAFGFCHYLSEFSSWRGKAGPSSKTSCPLPPPPLPFLVDIFDFLFLPLGTRLCHVLPILEEVVSFSFPVGEVVRKGFCYAIRTWRF